MTDKELKEIYLAGGCFWCTESDFQKINGVKEVISGYAGGDKDNPSYLEVAHGGTGHREAVKIIYDASVIDFRTLLLEFFDSIDPTDGGGQFHDRGESYTTAIFYKDESEKQIAEDLIKEINNSHIYEKPIATLVLPFKNFFDAEEYHQNFNQKDPNRYKSYRLASGREEMKRNVCRIKAEKGLVKLFASGNKNNL